MDIWRVHVQPLRPCGQAPSVGRAECTRRHGAAYGAASASAAELSIRDRCSIAMWGLTTTEALPCGEGLGALVVLAAMAGAFGLVDDDVVDVVGVVGVVGYDVATFVGIVLAR